MKKALAAFAAGLCTCALAVPASAQLTPEQAIAVDYDLGTLYIVDSTTLSVVSSINTGSDVIDVTVTPDGSTALVASFGAARMTFFDLTTSPPTDTGFVGIPYAAEDVEISCATAGFAVITDGGFSTGVTSVDLTTRSIVNTVYLPVAAEANAVSPDGSLVLAGSYSNGVVRLLNMSPSGVLTDTGQSVSTGGTINVAFLPDGKRALAVGNGLRVLDVTGGVLSLAQSLPTSVGFAQSITISHAGDRAYVMGCGSSLIETFDIDALGTLTSWGTFSHTGVPAVCFYGVDQIALSPSGQRLFVRHRSGASIFDTTTNMELAVVPFGGGFTGGGISTLCAGGPSAASLAYDQHPSSIERQNDTWDPIGVRVVDQNGDLYTDATDPITISLFSGTGVLGGTTSKAPVGGQVVFDDLTYDTAETISVLITSPDLLALGATIVVTPANSDLRVTSGGISITPSGATLEVGESALLEALVTNAGSAAATANVSFWLGDPDIPQANAQFLGSQSGSVPLGGSATFGVNWTPLQDGLASLFVVVDNTTPNGTESTPGDNRATIQASVGAAAEELAVSAGQRTAWPGAQTTAPVTITNIGFGPATITGVTLGPPGWLSFPSSPLGATLQPGESLLVIGQLDVPLGTPGGPLNGDPVPQAIPVALDTASGTFSGNLLVKVFDQAATDVTVQVVDDATSAPIANALVAAQDLPGNFTTDGAGNVTIQLPPGPNNLFAYRTGYVAQAGSFDVPEGSSSLEIRLTAGQTLGVEQVVSEPLSTQEILDRGVDVNDPVNNDVFDFVVSMEVGPPITLYNIELPKVQPTSGSTTFSGTGYIPAGGGGGGGYGGGSVLVTAVFDYNPYGRTETWIIIPGQVWVLKQFFEVTTFVVNNASAPNPEDVQLVDVEANLNLPSGLEFPALNGAPQSSLQSLGTLDAQESAQAVWIIRGDAPGSYQLNGLVTADLYAFQSFQASLSALATSDPFDVTLANIRCEFITPQSVTAGQPFTFGVLVTNESSAPAQLVRVILEEQDLILCTLEGTELIQDPLVSFKHDGGGNVVSATYTIGDLDPGKSGLAEFELISEVSGVIRQLDIENGCGAAPSPPVEAIPTPPTIVDQPDPVVACVGSVATFQITADGFEPITYQWRKDGVDIPGATGFAYSIGSVMLSDAGSYDVVVTNPGGEVVTDPAVLTVQEAPLIDAFPLPAEVCEGAPVVFMAGATGTPAPTYQWRKDGIDIAGATSASYSIASPTASDAGTYTVVATNPCGSDTFDVDLTVNTGPTISAQPVGGTVTEGSTLVLSVTASGTDPLTYQWQRDGTDVTGQTGASLSITASVDDAGSYSVVVSNDCGTVVSESADVVVERLVSIDIKPGSYPNCFNNNGNGTIPVAILGSDTFDVTLIDAGTVMLESMMIKVKGNGSYQTSISDWDGDGYLDMTIHIVDEDGVFTTGSETGTVTGQLLDGSPFVGTDSVCITQ